MPKIIRLHDLANELDEMRTNQAPILLPHPIKLVWHKPSDLSPRFYQLLDDNGIDISEYMPAHQMRAVLSTLIWERRMREQQSNGGTYGPRLTIIGANDG